MKSIVLYMNCPVDNTPLVISDRQGIEIDYCPQCRGVWLDRGELDKLIERSQSFQSGRPEPSHHDSRRHDDDDDRHHDRHNSHDYDNHHQKKHKKESFLGDMFDF